MSLLEGCPHFRGPIIHNKVFGDSSSVLFIKVSYFRVSC